MDNTNTWNLRLNSETENVENFYEIVPYADTDDAAYITYEYLSDEHDTDIDDFNNKKTKNSSCTESYIKKRNKTTMEKCIDDFSVEQCQMNFLNVNCNTIKDNTFRMPDYYTGNNTSNTSSKIQHVNSFCTEPIGGLESGYPSSTSLTQARRFSSYRSNLNLTYSLHTNESSDSSTNVSKNELLKKRTRKSLLKEILPVYEDHQLLGDSQLLRFSEQILKIKNTTYTEDTQSRRLGYCVSGQRIKQLEKRLLEEEYKIHEKVILLIGTNDLLHQTLLRSMCKSYDSVLRLLQQYAKKIVLLTIPPIPRFTSDPDHWSIVDHFNRFIIDKGDGKTVFTVDVANLFVGINNTTLNDYYESYFSDGRVDMLHLNKKGFKLLQAALDIHYFDKLRF